MLVGGFQSIILLFCKHLHSNPEFGVPETCVYVDAYTFLHVITSSYTTFKIKDCISAIIF